MKISIHDYKYLIKTNNMLASIHLIIRISVELSLIYLLSQAIHSEYYLSNIFSFLLILIIGFYHSFWGVAGYGHELFHNRVFSKKIINKTLFIISSAITYNNRTFFEKTHSRHHSKIFSKDDIEANGRQDFSLPKTLSYIFIDFPTMYRRIMYLFKNLIGVVPSEFKKHRLNIMKSSIEIIVINSILYSLIFVFTNSILTVLSFFIAQFSCSLMNRLLAQSQHLALDKKKALGPLYHSRTLTLPLALSFLYANMNFHCEHHLFPTVPYYNLPKLHKELLNRGFFIETKNLNYFLKDFWLDLKTKVDANEKCISVK